MRRARTAAFGLLLASVLFAVNPRDCVDLSARQDNDAHSPSGILVTITGHNHCSEDVDGGQCRFRVNAIGAGGTVIAKQSGRFGGTIAPRGRVETKVFVVCDPDRFRSITVDPQ